MLLYSNLFAIRVLADLIRSGKDKVEWRRGMPRGPVPLEVHIAQKMLVNAFTDFCLLYELSLLAAQFSQLSKSQAKVVTLVWSLSQHGSNGQ